MKQHDSPSIFARLGGFFIFFIMAAGCFYWFIQSIFDIKNQLTTESYIVYFDKGSIYMLGAGIAIIFLLPQISHYIINSHLADKQYKICTEASHQWMLYKNIVYTKDQLSCDKLIEKNK